MLTTKWADYKVGWIVNQLWIWDVRQEGSRYGWLCHQNSRIFSTRSKGYIVVSDLLEFYTLQHTKSVIILPFMQSNPHSSNAIITVDLNLNLSSYFCYLMHSTMIRQTNNGEGRFLEWGGWKRDSYYICRVIFHQNYYLQLLILFMRANLHKSLSAACSLKVSILSQLPENSLIESSEYIAEENSKGQLVKVDAATRRHHRFRSLLQAREVVESEEENVKCSMLTDTRVEYFDAIEKSLLVENQNLKNHNRFLIEQVKKLYQRQKSLKHDVLVQQAQAEQLIKLNSQLESTLQLLSNDIIAEIHSLQLLLASNHRHHRAHSSYRVKTFQDFDSAETNSHTISQSLQAMKQIFNKEDYHHGFGHEQQNYASIPSINPERYEQELDFDNEDSLQMNKALQYSENMRRKIGRRTNNHPILRNLEETIANLHTDLAAKAKNHRKTMNFSKLNTMGG